MTGASSGVGASSRIKCAKLHTPDPLPPLAGGVGTGTPASGEPPGGKSGGGKKTPPFPDALPAVRTGSSTTLRLVIMSSRRVETKQPEGADISYTSSLSNCSEFALLKANSS